MVSDSEIRNQPFPKVQKKGELEKGRSSCIYSHITFSIPHPFNALFPTYIIALARSLTTHVPYGITASLTIPSQPSPAVPNPSEPHISILVSRNNLAPLLSSSHRPHHILSSHNITPSARRRVFFSRLDDKGINIVYLH